MDIINRIYQSASLFGKENLSDPADRLNTPYVHFDSVEALFCEFMDALDQLSGKPADELQDKLMSLLKAFEKQGFANGFKYGVAIVQELSGMKAA